MPGKAMIQPSDSQNQATPDTPLYAELRNGRWSILDVEDTPCLTITADGQAEMDDPDRLPMDALPQIDIMLAAPPAGDDYGGF